MILGGQQGWGQQVAEVLGQREQIELANGAGRALAQGREPGAQLGEEGRGVHIRRYFYRPIDRQARLFGMKRDFSLPAARAEYARLAQSLARPGWISEGHAQDRGPGAGGPCYQWTRKVRNKTVSVALSKEQYEWLQEAIQNWRAIQATLKEMQRLSRRVLFETVKNLKRRKRLGKKVLGLV